MFIILTYDKDHPDHRPRVGEAVHKTREAAFDRADELARKWERQKKAHELLAEDGSLFDVMQAEAMKSFSPVWRVFELKEITQDKTDVSKLPPLDWTLPQ